jgi:hypothetical protein
VAVGYVTYQAELAYRTEVRLPEQANELPWVEIGTYDYRRADGTIDDDGADIDRVLGPAGIDHAMSGSRVWSIEVPPGHVQAAIAALRRSGLGGRVYYYTPAEIREGVAERLKERRGR